MAEVSRSEQPCSDIDTPAAAQTDSERQPESVTEHSGSPAGAGTSDSATAADLGEVPFSASNLPYLIVVHGRVSGARHSFNSSRKIFFALLPSTDGLQQVGLVLYLLQVLQVTRKATRTARQLQQTQLAG